ncbi:hypothetical protein LWC35_14590 [Pseudonocardia kujensis]|uniref:hypothetical protein n=1 Tax=Pseudonocardia kujensis TaxID=1128675 RepID=UPI001E289913|nr:hypothetical protein [Pseudonocardia kujensis]MCE0764129.1 hypothetical protein [Pseudonocardia kujensis]
MPGPPTEAARRRRQALVVLAGITVVVVALVAGLVALLLGVGRDPGPTPLPGTGAAAVDGEGWDLAAQTALATRAMPPFPKSASQPHTLSSDSAGPPLSLPAPGVIAGRYVPGGFPGTVEGAIAQQAALMVAGLAGGDPDTYAAAYTSVALPGAPAAAAARMTGELRVFRSRAGLPATGPIAGMQVTYSPTSALVKGTTDGGRYAVVCVLGELTVQYHGQIASGGIGDCQALRHGPTADGAAEWRVSPGAAAAPGPDLWPGTAEAVAAGFRPLA